MFKIDPIQKQYNKSFQLSSTSKRINVKVNEGYFPIIPFKLNSVYITADFDSAVVNTLG